MDPFKSLGINTTVTITSCIKKLQDPGMSVVLKEDIARSIDIWSCSFEDVEALVTDPTAEYKIVKIVLERVKWDIVFHQVKAFLSDESIDVRLKMVIARKLRLVTFNEVKEFLKIDAIEVEVSDEVIDKITDNELTQEHIDFLLDHRIDIYVRMNVWIIIDEDRFSTIRIPCPRDYFQRQIEAVLAI